MEARHEDPRALKKRIAEQDKEIADQKDLIKLLMEIPKPKSEEPSAKETTAVQTKTRAGRAGRKSEDGRGDIPLDSSAAARRSEAAR